MDEAFKRPSSPEYDPLKQTEVRGDFVDTGEARTTNAEPISRAQIIVNEYDRTIEFAKFLEGLLDDDLKDIVVEIDPEEEPEVWMAMQRIFSNPNPKITYQSYTQILTALEDIDAVESEANNEFAEEDEFIKHLVDLESGIETESDTGEMTIINEDEVFDPTVIRKIEPEV